MKVIIPCAGLGSRFGPWARAVPKELAIVGDRPAVQHVVDEALSSGIESAVLVTSRGKHAIEDYFEHEPFPFCSVRQSAPLGLGHAVLQARHVVGEEAFAVSLPDDIYRCRSPALKQMLACGYHCSSPFGVVALMEVPRDEAHKYGIVDASRVDCSNVYRIHDLVEKPTTGIPLGPLAVVGRYLLPPRVFRILAETAPGHGGEIQLTDALRVLAKQGALVGVVCKGERFDVGTLEGWRRANEAGL